MIMAMGEESIITGVRSSSAEVPLADFYMAGDHQVAPPPGTFPFTRGIDPRGYRDALWIMGQYAGYGTPAETKARLRRLLEQGQTGLSVALDLPTQMGMDSDDPRALGEVGKVGVPLDTVEDLVTLMDGLPLEQVRQMRTTANSIAPMFAAMLIVALERLGLSPSDVRLMLQNDPLKEYSARGTFIFPPAAGQKLAVDMVEYAAQELPHWEPIEFCGYHIRDAGGTAVHELGVATVNGLAYLDEVRDRGVDLDAAAKSLHLFLSAGVDVFEEAAKFRAARRMWARILNERYGVKPENAGIKIFAYTLGGALTAQLPLTNVVRVSYEALSAVLGGAQTLATSSYDEALGLPSPAAAALALRTQQVLAHEAGAAKVADPLGGSYYVEALTDAIEEKVQEYVDLLLEQGGAVAALESGRIAQDLADAAYDHQRSIETGERLLVGVNFVKDDAAPQVLETFRVPPELQEEQCRRLAEVKAARAEEPLARGLALVTEAARAGTNTVPALIEAARAHATIGEMVAALGEVYGRYTPARIN
jgi:methylmalonyl-CoA mutase N-terminal domain/subunit